MRVWESSEKDVTLASQIVTYQYTKLYITFLGLEESDWIRSYGLIEVS